MSAGPQLLFGAILDEELITRRRLQSMVSRTTGSRGAMLVPDWSWALSAVDVGPIDEADLVLCGWRVEE